MSRAAREELAAVADDGTRLAADVHSPPAPAGTVLLLGGQSLEPDVLDGLRDDLAAVHRVVVVHTRGTGRSQAGPGGDAAAGEWSTRRFARDAVAVLDALGAARAHVHGFSMGGRVAQVLAAEHPGRVQRLVLGATGPGGAAEVARAPEVTRALRRLGTAAGRAALAELFFTPAFAAAHPQLAARFAPRAPAAVQRGHHAASTGHDGTGLLARVAAPALVVHGEDDAMTPPGNARALAALLPRARAELLPGARHGYLAEARERSSALVLGFLAG
ncbi:alpha/beta fold hydrolase [Kineococcus gypseus]|uniref:alpha/beta fold hydrolase n=1 Tax=Kineococcus gypseus TaxID=1637102 RepID=UPI003D7D9CE0